MTPAPTDSREKAADALDGVAALLDRIEQALDPAIEAVLARFDHQHDDGDPQ